jgi:hypothetical protein
MMWQRDQGSVRMRVGVRMIEIVVVQSLGTYSGKWGEGGWCFLQATRIGAMSVL